MRLSGDKRHVFKSLCHQNKQASKQTNKTQLLKELNMGQQSILSDVTTKPPLTANNNRTKGNCISQ